MSVERRREMGPHELPARWDHARRPATAKELKMPKTRTLTSSPANADWTVMVYLAGDNNLTDECTYSLTEMKKAEPGNRVNIIAQFDPRDPLIPTQRYKIKMDDQSGSLAADIIDSSVDSDTGDPETLIDFITFCIKNYAADHYMVVLAGHGGGIERNFLLKDESSGGSLTILKLKEVFKTIHERHKGKDGKGLVIDIVGMDVCLMSMAEICYELRRYVQILVGCESYSPAAGWPYRQIFDRLGNLANMTPQLPGRTRGQDVQSKLATAIVEEFANFYADYSLGGLSVDSSAMNLRNVGKLKNLVKELAEALSAELTNPATKDKFKDAIVLAHWEAQSYNGEMFADLYDFCDCLQQRYDTGQVAEASREVMEFIEPPHFVLKSCYSGPAFQYSHGVSIYFPWAEVIPDYGNLSFAKDTGSGWGKFLEIYTTETRREPRPPRKPSDLGRQVQEVDGSASKRLNAINAAANAHLTGRPPGKVSFRALAGTNTPSGARPFRKVDDRKVDDRGANPVRSMRNPPVVAFPDDCIRRREDVIRGLERLFLK